MEFNTLTACLLAALVALISVVVTVFVMKGNSDTRYVTKEQCTSQQQIQCAERSALRERLEMMEKASREEMSSIKRTLRITLNMSRALVTWADATEEQKTAILNNDGGVQ